MTKLIKTSEQAAQTQKILEKLEEVFSLIKDAESGQRGYVITGEETYLEPYYAATKEIKQELKELRSLTGANPNQQRRLDTLEPLIAQRLALTKQVINIRQNEGFKPAKQIVLTGKGKNLMDRIRNVIGEIENAENVLLTQRTQQAEASARNAISTFCIGLILDVFILAGEHYIICREIIERKRVEAALRESEDRFQTFMNNSPVMAYMKDEKGRYLYVNEPLERVFNLKLAGLQGKTDFDWLPEEVAEQVRENDIAVLSTGKTAEILETIPTPDGCPHYWLVFKFPVKDVSGRRLIGGVAVDITERKQAEEKIKTSLQEKEVLLKEIHHRVKNNLQIVSGLLYLQSRYVEDELIRQVLQENRTRIQSMALIHEKLYGSENLEKIDFKDYIYSLLQALFVSYGVNTDVIELKINSEQLYLDIDTAIYCGLIINELVANAVKHAFTAGNSGEIAVEFHETKEKSFELLVSDNGVGLPEEFDFTSYNSLGLRLINSLVTKQLNGTIDLDRSQGTKFKICFNI